MQVIMSEGLFDAELASDFDVPIDAATQGFCHVFAAMISNHHLILIFLEMAGDL